MDLSIISGQQMEAFFEKRLRHLNVSDSISIRSVSESVGKGMFAERSIAENEIIYNEMQLIGRKLHEQIFDSCSNCLRVIGDLPRLWECCESYEPNRDCPCEHDFDDSDHDRHSNDGCCEREGEIQLPFKTPCPDLHLLGEQIQVPVDEIIVKEMVACRQSCGVMYCSEECADKHWLFSHQLMCPARNAPMQDFADFTNETNEVLFMVGEVIAALIIQIERAGATNEALTEALLPLRMFISKPWTEAVTVPPELDRDEAQEFVRVLDFLVNECQQHLIAALRDYSSSDLYQQLFERDFISRLMGLFETNNIRMSSRSAISLLADKLDDLESVPSCLSPEQRMRLAAYQDLTVEGVGLYSLHSCINHSCDPNCMLLKLQGGTDAKVALIALRDIAKGEEITISYIDEDADLKARHASLMDYGFQCKCTKCVLEGMTISDAA